jgi:hypothetical protein
LVTLRNEGRLMLRWFDQNETFFNEPEGLLHSQFSRE